MKKLYYGGVIRTMDEKNPLCQAVLTENGKILAVGSLSAFEGFEGERVDLAGKMMMPLMSATKVSSTQICTDSVTSVRSFDM